MNWMKKIEEIKSETADLSKEEDLSIAIMNLVSLEEHFYFTAMKTRNRKYLELLNSVRGIRKAMMKKIVDDPKGEEWCISKHILAATMRLIEVGTKELAEGKDADKTFQSAFSLYSLFFAVNLKLLGFEELTEKDSDKKMGRFSSIIKKIVDCCRE